MRKLVYNFENGKQVDTYAEAVAIAKTTNKPFIAEVVPIETAYKGAWSGLKEKYRKYFRQ